MNIGNMLKIFQYGLLRQNGIQVTPDQLGLKTDPFAKYQGTSNGVGGFASFLNNSPNLTIPTPPTPPADTTNPAAQAQFQQELVNYSQQMQSYNQNIMQLMLQQFQLMQQRLAAQQQQQQSQSATASTGIGSGVGGILGGLSDIGLN